MKRIFTILAIVLLTANMFAQSPEKISYQAVIRNAGDALVTNTQISMQISILQGSVSGIAVYVETQTPTTNANGLVSIEIGAGTVVSGDLSTIDWANDTYFINTETDPAGGTSYSIIGTSQLLSVPYALYAKEAGNIPDVSGIATNATAISANKQAIQDTAVHIREDLTPARYVGELYSGGIVFWVDHTGKHGLIVSMVDLSTAQAWSNIANTLIGTTNDWDGAGNTTVIIGQSGHTSSAAKLCDDYTNTDYGTGTYSDWYLPSNAELKHIWGNFYEVQKALSNDGNAATTPLSRNYYWSSSEYDGTDAWGFYFGYGTAGYDSKSTTSYVRAVRAF